MTTLGPRGRKILGMMNMRGLDIIGASVGVLPGELTKHRVVGGASRIGDVVKPWDNTQSFSAGDAVYNNGHYYRALNDVSPPFMTSIMKGDEPPSDSWREITQQQAYAVTGSVVGAATAASIDVAGLKTRLDSLPHTNNEVWDLWVTSGHGTGLAQRVAGDAQNLLNQALIPTAELSVHDQVMAFAQDRFNTVEAKVMAQPADDNPSPVWDDVASYLIDGSNLANMLEGTLNQTVKWTDVKDAVSSAATGAGNALRSAASTAKWITYSLIGGAVVLGVGALYVIYKLISSPAGGAIVGGYLGGRRR